MNNFLQILSLRFYGQILNEEGQDLVEYALMIVLVALGCIAGINSVASAINNIFSNISTTLN